MLTILEHTSSSYSPRTYINAAKANATIAFAADFTTAGEKCTHKAAGDKYLALSLKESWLINARKLWKYLLSIDKVYDCHLNIAGNGIYTLSKHSITQEYVNQYLYNVLFTYNNHCNIASIRSGGQTGVDIAGAKAGYDLGIPTTVLLPKGFIQRDVDGKDMVKTHKDIYEQIIGN